MWHDRLCSSSKDQSTDLSTLEYRDQCKLPVKLFGAGKNLLNFSLCSISMFRSAQKTLLHSKEFKNFTKIKIAVQSTNGLSLFEVVPAVWWKFFEQRR
jgi:hypothetical protein